jgi:ribosomal protein S18 acetylase RimI-like enzyme
MESAYADAGVDRFAVWVHETDQSLPAELDARGYRVEETTRVMARSLPNGLPDAPDLATESLLWPPYLSYLEAAGTPPGLLSGVDPTAYHVLGVEMAGQCVATAIAFDHDGDCGIFNASTLEPFRRRGIGTALVTRHLRDAARRGCATATLQATPIAERVYASVGFRDLGCYFEYVPASGGTTLRARRGTARGRS